MRHFEVFHNVFALYRINDQSICNENNYYLLDLLREILSLC